MPENLIFYLRKRI